MTRWELYREVEKQRMRDLLAKHGPLSSADIQRRMGITQSAVVTRMQWLGRQVRVAGWAPAGLRGGRRAPLYGLRMKGELDVREPAAKTRAERDRDYRIRKSARKVLAAEAATLGPWAGLLRDQGDQAA